MSQNRSEIRAGDQVMRRTGHRTGKVKQMDGEKALVQWTPVDREWIYTKYLRRCDDEQDLQRHSQG